MIRCGNSDVGLTQPPTQTLVILDIYDLNQPTQLIQVSPCGRIASIASGCHSAAPEGFLDLRALKEFAMGLGPGLDLSHGSGGRIFGALSLLPSVGDHIFSLRHFSL